jgi:Cu-Zn family superoxide dismutase
MNAPRHATCHPAASTSGHAARIAAGVLAAAWLASCSTVEPGPSARTELKPTAGNSASGWVQFDAMGERVQVTAEVRGLKPNAEHGFHVHDKGDCSAPDAMSAGGHFNPGGKPHGHHGQAERHAGDMPSLKADATGVARLNWSSTLLGVGAGPANVIGRAVIVHRDPDDYVTQPTGNSGPRLACGVIAAR